MRKKISSFVAVAVLLGSGALLAQEEKKEMMKDEKPMMASGLKLTNVIVPVDDYDAALAFYIGKLGLEKRVDEQYGEGERWLTVAAKGSDLELTLQKAAPDKKHAVSGWVFSTDDCQKSYESMKAQGVKFVETPKSQPWGVQALFEDPFGNRFFLVSPPAASGAGQ